MAPRPACNLPPIATGSAFESSRGIFRDRLAPSPRKPLFHAMQRRASSVHRPAPSGFIASRLRTLAHAVPDAGTGAHELKHDGFRMICRRDRCQVFSRWGWEWTAGVTAIVAAIRRVPASGGGHDPRQRRWQRKASQLARGPLVNAIRSRAHPQYVNSLMSLMTRFAFVIGHAR